MLKTESIKRFLIARTVKDLAELYNPNMECQVNVAQDGGQRVEDDYKGKKWHGWTDGIQTWKSFRIPYKAATEPEYQDTNLNYDLDAHAEGIGMTGWDWVNKVSRWVAFDFDAIINHKQGLTDQQIKEIISVASDIDWVTVRKSTSGKGIHLYVMLNPVPTANHTEHAALARSVLGYMSALTGFDFESKIDGCGGNMWVWHRKMKGTDGLSVVKQGRILDTVPTNWRDHLNVITHKPRKCDMDTLTSQRKIINLDETHKSLIKWLDCHNWVWWWDADAKMLVTHTGALAAAHKELGLKGVFQTISGGTDPNTQNCFCYTMDNGAWVVRRFTPGVSEAETWHQDTSGWTRCYYNQELGLETACKIYGGVENDKGGFGFVKIRDIIPAAKALGVDVVIPDWLVNRKATMKRHKDGRLIIEVEREERDEQSEMRGWLAEKYKGLIWRRIYDVRLIENQEPEAYNYDDVLRHLTNNGEDCGWVIKNKFWQAEPLTHVRLALMSKDLGADEVANILGDSVLKCWELVNLPFKPEYPGDRVWNRDAAQMRYLPKAELSNLSYPSWTKILNHCGKSLDDVVQSHQWCRDNAITCGADYLKCWVASLFQESTKPLPYLFFWGPQNSGKSIFHEAMELLMTRGYTRADLCLQEGTNFNGELENAVLCVVEETDLSRNKSAYNKIKDWVTARSIQIRHLYQSPYHIQNTTHWVQCANDAKACPIFAGDTRITMIYVPSLEEVIPKDVLISRLQDEATDFITSVINIELPKSMDRLNLPVLESEHKGIIQDQNKTDLERFISEECHHAPGHMVSVSEFHEKFMMWLDPESQHEWSKIRIGRELPAQYPKGRRILDGHHYIGNISFEPKEPNGVVMLKAGKLFVKGNK